MKRILLVLLALLPLMLQGQSPEGVTVKRDRAFIGAELYGFMNGGAELFLEYGVQRLQALDVEYKGEEYGIEIYEMPTAASAFGIYSLHTFKCLRVDTLGINCLSKYQLQAAIGNKYVSIVFQSGSAKARANVDELFHLYIDTTNVDKLVIPDLLKSKLPYTSSLKYLKGDISASNAQQTLTKVLKAVSFFEIWYVSKENKALIYLKSRADLEVIKANVLAEDIVEEGEGYIYLKCPEKEEAESNFGTFAF